MSPDFKIEKVILEQTADREVFYFTIENAGELVSAG